MPTLDLDLGRLDISHAYPMADERGLMDSTCMCGSDMDIERGHMNRLHGRVAFVTGAGHGIGRASKDPEEDVDG